MDWRLTLLHGSRLTGWPPQGRQALPAESAPVRDLYVVATYGRHCLQVQMVPGPNPPDRLPSTVKYLADNTLHASPSVFARRGLAALEDANA